ncbi:vitelline membrane outer layer protein 1-like [Gopherus evgoodei]|uniref:vitelline membrane outer layer protein 1-like n=1 Tax=Gopherus evgoodei TaxID=1825980 RepID=UPI0011CEEA17|nr:vitelline membrane outer layer protein 1-like [Gopherus evgoodei]
MTPEVELPQLAGDDTALNGIRLLCPDNSTIQSNVGPWGFWGPVKKCPSGQRLTQFRLRVEPCRGLKDDMAANNIEFVCTGGVELKGDGRCWGKWGPQSRSCSPWGISTIATKVEAPQGKGDDTALNDAYFKCGRPETLAPSTTLPPTSTEPSNSTTQPPTTSTLPPTTQPPNTSTEPPTSTTQTRATPPQTPLDLSPDPSYLTADPLHQAPLP